MSSLRDVSTKTYYRRLSGIGSNTVAVLREPSSKHSKQRSAMLIITLSLIAIFLGTNTFDNTSSLSQSSDLFINKDSLVSNAQASTIDEVPTNPQYDYYFNNRTIANGNTQIARSTDVIQQLREVRMKNLLRGTRRYQLTTENQETFEETQILASKISQWEEAFQNSLLSRPN